MLGRRQKQRLKPPWRKAIVPGGGVALLRAAERRLDKAQALEGDEALGVRRSSQNVWTPTPLRLLITLGLDGAVVVNRVPHLKGKTDGYDADKDEVMVTWYRVRASSIPPKWFG